MNLTFRTADQADSALLAQIGAETFFDTFAADNTPEDMAAYLAESFSPAIQGRELANPAIRFVILEVDGVPAAYAKLEFEALGAAIGAFRGGQVPACIPGARRMEIVRFYARKPWIGKGIGARLMQHCLEAAEEAGCDTAWLDVWQKNPRAIAFYQKWGFVIVGEQTFTVGSDVQQDYLMARAVSAGAGSAAAK